MKLALKPFFLVAGLFGAGTLLAYGTYFPGAWNGGHHGPGFHYVGMRYAMGTGRQSDVMEDLSRIRRELKITPAQEEAWNDFRSKLLAHTQRSRELHDYISSTRFTVPDSQGRAPMIAHWEGRKEAEEAAQSLISMLTEAQRLKADQLFSAGFRGHY